MADEIKLRIIVSGGNAIPDAMKQAAVAVDQSTKQMATSLAQAKTAATTAAQQTQASFTTAARANTASQQAASNAIAAAFNSGIRGTQETVNAFNAGIRASATQSVAGFEAQARASFNRAKDSVDLLSNSIGIGIPRELKKVIAGIPGIQAGMAAAFNVFAVIGFIQVLSQLPALFQQIIDKLAGWNEAAQKMYATSIELNEKLYQSTIKLRDAAVANASIGLEGGARQIQDQKNLGEVLRNTTADHLRAAAAAKVDADRVAELTQRILDLKGKIAAGALLGGIGAAPFIGQLLTAQKDLEAAKASRDKNDAAAVGLQIRRNELIAQEATQVRETAATQAKESRALADARIEAEKRVTDANLTLAETRARNAVAMGNLSAAQEALIFEGLEEAKLAATRRSIDARIALARQSAATDPAGSAQAITRLSAEKESAERASQARIAEIRTQGMLGTRAREQEVFNAEVAAAQDTAQRKASIEEEWISQQESMHRLSIEQAAHLRTVSENERFTSQRNAIQAQIAQASEFPEKNRALILSLHQELETAEIEHQATLGAIRAEAAQKQQELDQRLFALRQAAADRAANFELQQASRLNNQRLATGQQFLGQWEAQELASINRWYNAQREILEQSLAHARQVYTENSAQYQQVLDQMTQLDRERLTKVQAIQDEVMQAYTRAFDRVGDNFLGNMKQWALGQQTFKQALANTWNEMVLDLAGMLAKMGLKWLAHWALVNILHVGAKSTEIATEAAAAATKHAIMASTNVATVMSNAAVAGAAGFASVMVALPFPANVAVAPAVAASSMGAVMALAPLAAFEKGGLVNSTEIALLHKREMVLPAHLSEGIQGMIRSGQGGGGTQNISLGGVHFHGPADKNTVDYAEKKFADTLKKTIRNGHFRPGSMI